jgi:hypothetical protein
MSRFDGLYPMRRDDRNAVLSVGVLAPGALHVVEAVGGDVFVTEEVPDDAWEIGEPFLAGDEELAEAKARLWYAIQAGPDFAEEGEDLELWVFDGERRKPIAFHVMLAAALVLLSLAFRRD